MNDLINSSLEKLKEKNIPNAEIDLRVLLNYSKYSKNEIILSNFDLDQININLFNKVLNRRLSKEPISKIINKKNFWKDEFYIDKNVSFADLKQTLLYFAKEMFGENAQIRLRPSYFPFTEPSAEMDIAYSIVDNKIKLGEGDKWLEILGCGMVNPKVIENCKMDSSKFQGYAFGLGLDRITMLKHGLTDIRSFFNGNNNWLKANGFSLGRI